MNSPSLTPERKRLLNFHINYEHQLIQAELNSLSGLAASTVDDAAIEIEFRNRFQWISQVLKAHVISEEHVILRFLDEHTHNPIQKSCIQSVCRTNFSIDQTLKEIEMCPWKKRKELQFKILTLIQWMQLHIDQEEKRLFKQLNRLPAPSSQRLLREFVSTENHYMNWFSELEMTAPDFLQ